MRASIRRLHPEPRRRVWAAIDAIRQDPYAGKPLIGELAGMWRSAVGRLRIVYVFDEATVSIELVERRETIYEDLVRRRRGGGESGP